MKFTTIILSLTIATANAKTRRRLNTIKGDESDASMSYASALSPASGGGSKSSNKAPTGSPTSAPIPEPGECNSVITTGNDNGNVFTLQKSLLCDCPDNPDIKPALTVDGRGTVLNLNGYTVECKPGAGFSSKPVAIKVVGTANTIMGPGTVKGGGSFSNGIALQGGGFHTVDGVTIGPVGKGIVIESNDNTIINNFITEPGFDGVVIFGNDGNVIKGNRIVNAGDYGIRLSLDQSLTLGTSDDNQILDNTIISSGIFVYGKRVVIQGNTIDQSGRNGIEVYSFGSFVSEDVIIKKNSITNSNGDGGIKISSLNGAVTLNTVIIDNTFAGNGNDNLVDGGDGTTKAGNTPSLLM